jgi:predicted phosphodiesterase
MLKVGKELGIPVERTIHTGDVVAYCAQPRETAELLRDSGIHCLMGNCEESIAQGSLDCGCGFPEDSACAAYSINWYAHVMDEYKGHDDLRTWMGQMPRRIEFSMCGRTFAVVHGSPAHISKFLWPSTSFEELRDDFNLLPQHIDGVISGHSGIPFVHCLPGESGDDNLWLNAGVIGMPANDGTTRGWFAVMTPHGQDIEVSVRELRFDAKAAADAIYSRPSLNRGYADSLISGIWPSHDILPLKEQMDTGCPLSETVTIWRANKRKSSLTAMSSWPAVAIAVASTAALVTLTMIASRRSRSGLISR